MRVRGIFEYENMRIIGLSMRNKSRSEILW